MAPWPCALPSDTGIHGGRVPSEGLVLSCRERGIFGKDFLAMPQYPEAENE